MLRPSVFGMISTTASAKYTAHALRSFFQTVQLSPGDTFLLIENDGASVTEADIADLPITVLRNSKPKGFAENANQILRRAMDEQADAYLLNNDLIFTNSWLQPLLTQEDAIISPLSNREIQYEVGDFQWQNALSLEDYLGREGYLSELVAVHAQKMHGYQQVIGLPFFCVKIPPRIYQVVGLFDETFGRGGAEDNDYCARVCLCGFPIKYALSSYVLHFSGKSTWSGAETEEETSMRCQTFRTAFEAKWGPVLRALYIDEDPRVLKSRPDLLVEAAKGNMRAVVEGLRSTGTNSKSQ